MLSKPQVIIEILPDRIEVLVYEGPSCVSCEHLQLEQSDDVNQWANNIRRSSKPLAELVSKMQLADYSAYVLYTSPTQAVDIHSLAVRSQSQAVEAAKLSCYDSLSYSTLSAVCEGYFLGRDAGKNNSQSHVLVAAEREDVAEAIASAVGESGLNCLGAMPMASVVASCGVTAVLNNHLPHHARLYVGEHSSLFLIGSQGNLLFTRRIGLGLESLVNSLMHPIRSTSLDKEIELTHDQARQLLEQHGIPSRDDLVNEQYQLTGAQVLPLMQPVLQRFIVELRQSIRFGLSENEREQLTVCITGLGAKILGLGDLIEQELTVQTVVDPAYDKWEFSNPGSDSVLIESALQSTSVFEQINLQPRQLVMQRKIGRIRRYLWTGAAAALVLIGVDAMRFQFRLNDARNQAAVYATQLDDLKALQATGQKLQDALAAMAKLETTIGSHVGRRADFHACLHELSRIIPQGIRFDKLTFIPNDNGTMGTLSGYSLENSKDTAQAELEKCIALLRSSPLFSEVILNSVKRDKVEGMQGQRFSLTLKIHQIQLPGNGLDAVAQASDDGGSRQ